MERRKEIQAEIAAPVFHNTIKYLIISYTHPSDHQDQESEKKGGKCNMQIRPYSGPAEKVRCINCLHYNDKRKPFGCKYSGARISIRAAKTRDIFCDYFIDERSVVGAARAGWRGHAVGIQGKRGQAKAGQLPSTINSSMVKARILTAARKRFRVRKGLNAVYEHGHWWLILERGYHERTFDVVDASGPGSIGGFDFELVSEIDY